MVRESLAVAFVLLVTTAGCSLGPIGPSTSGQPTEAATSTATANPTPRPANGTIVYGPESPSCPGYDDGNRSDFHYGKGTVDRYTVDDTPAELSASRVEKFLNRSLGPDAAVSIFEEKAERVRFRTDTFDVSAKYGSDRYFHGIGDEPVGELLVVVNEDRTTVYAFRIEYC